MVDKPMWSDKINRFTCVKLILDEDGVKEKNE